MTVLLAYGGRTGMKLTVMLETRDNMELVRVVRDLQEVGHHSYRM